MSQPRTEAGRRLLRKTLGVRITAEEVVEVERQAAAQGGETLDAAWAEAEAALPENGWLTVGTIGRGLVTVEAFHWPEGEHNRSIARAFRMPLLKAMLLARDQLREYARLTRQPEGQ